MRIISSFIRGFVWVLAAAVLLGSAYYWLSRGDAASFLSPVQDAGAAGLETLTEELSAGDDLTVGGEAQVTTSVPTYMPFLIQAFPRAGSTFGIEMYNVAEKELVDLVVASGTRWVRRNGIVWSKVESTEGVYTWGSEYMKLWDQDLLNARQNGLEPILVVRTTPTWARYPEFPDHLCGPIRPDKYAAFGNFMHELVKRYSGHPYYVRYYQIGNEPEAEVYDVKTTDPYGCWGMSEKPYFNGEAYGDMLAAVYPRIKQAHPQAQVVFGGLLLDCHPDMAPAGRCDGAPLSFLEGVLYRHGNNDGKNYFDFLAFHGYDYYYGKLGQYGHAGWGSAWSIDGPVIFPKMSFLKTVLDKYGAGDKPIINSEGGLICVSVNPEECATADWELTKAYYVPQYFVAGKALGLDSTIWYSVTGWRGSGLVDIEREPTLAYTSYKFAVSQLSYAEFQREISNFSGVFAYEFHDGKRNIWFAWSQDGLPHTITLPSQPRLIRNVFGVEIPVTGANVVITTEPIYIEW